MEICQIRGVHKEVYLYRFYLEIEIDHESAKLKYADDSKILGPVWCNCTDNNAVHIVIQKM